MDLARECPPLDPLKFRDDLMELMDQAEAEGLGEPDFSFFEFAGIRLVCKYVQSKEDFVPGQVPYDDPDSRYCTSASMRISQLMRGLKGLNAPGLVTVKPDGEQDVHMAVFEAAAVVPYSAHPQFILDVLAEAHKRVPEIDVVDDLFPNDPK